MVIYKGKRLSDGLKKDMPTGTLVSMSDTGYMNKDLFQLWLEHFKMNLQVPNSPALLILDGHGSHVKAIDGLKYAEQNNITIICLPPHSTHWTQPQDRSYFKPLKAYYAHECRKFMREHPGKAITRYNFGKLFTAAYQKTSSMDIAIQSFRATGIYPLNKNIFGDDVFAPADTTNRELAPNDGQVQPSAEIATNGEVPGGGNQVASGVGDVVNVEQDASGGDVATGEQGQSGGGDSHNRQEDQSSATNATNDEHDQMGGGDVDNDEQAPGTSTESLTEASNSFEKMRPLPKKQFSEKKRIVRSRSTASRVLTSAAHISSLEEDLRISGKKSCGVKKRNLSQGNQNVPKKVCKVSKVPEKAVKKRKLTCREDKPKGRKPGNSATRSNPVHPVRRSATNDQDASNNCLVCGEFGRDRELWIRCTSCGFWAHFACSGANVAAGYICDYCVNERP